MADSACGTCRHWAVLGPVQVGEESREYGQCRRDSPVIVPGATVTAATLTGAPQGQWPGTLDDDWCGEYMEDAE